MTIDSGYRVAIDPDIIIDTDILVQLHLAATEERNLQIISATIEVQAATLALVVATRRRLLQQSLLHTNDFTSPRLARCLGDGILAAPGSCSP